MRRPRVPASRAWSRGCLAFGGAFLALGLYSLYQAYFVPMEGIAALGPFFLGLAITPASGVLFWLALRLSPDAPTWLLATTLAGAGAGLATMSAVLVVAGAGMGWFFVVSLAAALVTAYDARRRR